MGPLAAAMMALFGLVCLHPSLADNHPYDGKRHVMREHIPFWPMFYPPQCNPVRVNYSNDTNATHCTFYKIVTSCNCSTYNKPYVAGEHTNYSLNTTFQIGHDATPFTNTVTTNCTLYGNCTNKTEYKYHGWINTTTVYTTYDMHPNMTEDCNCTKLNVSYVDECNASDPPKYPPYVPPANETLNRTCIDYKNCTCIDYGNCTDTPTPAPTVAPNGCVWYNDSFPYTTNATNSVNAQNLTGWDAGWDCPTPMPTFAPTANATLPNYSALGWTNMTDEPVDSQVCYALCKVPHFPWGVSKWDGLNCYDSSENVTEGTYCGITEMEGYYCDAIGRCLDDHTFENMDARCRVQFAMLLVGTDWDTFITNACDDRVNETRHFLTALTIMFYETKYEIYLDESLIDVSFDVSYGAELRQVYGSGVVKATINVYPPAPEVIMYDHKNVDVLPGARAIAKSETFAESVYEGLKDYPCMSGFTKVRFVSTYSMKATDCVGTWRKWQPCDAHCGAGTKKRRYRIVQQQTLGGYKCNATADVAPCWSGPCATPEPTTIAPTPKPTPMPTPAPPCQSTSGKSDKQCLKKCNDASSCPTTCRYCNDECACSAIAAQAKIDFRTEKKETALAHRKNGAPTLTPTPPPTIPCSNSDTCERTSFCWSGACQNTRDAMVCKRFYGTPTDDGWTWEAVRHDANFMCDDEDDYDHRASKPKAKKHLKKEHVWWQGPRANMKEWYQQRADEWKDQSKSDMYGIESVPNVGKHMDSNMDGMVSQSEFVAAGGSSKEFAMYDLNSDGMLDASELGERYYHLKAKKFDSVREFSGMGEAPKAIRKYQDRPEAWYYSNTEVVPAGVTQTFPKTGFGHEGHAPNSGKMGPGGRRLNAEVVDGAMAKSPLVIMMLALSQMLF